VGAGANKSTTFGGPVAILLGGGYLYNGQEAGFAHSTQPTLCGGSTAAYCPGGLAIPVCLGSLNYTCGLTGGASAQAALALSVSKGMFAGSAACDSHASPWHAHGDVHCEYNGAAAGHSPLIGIAFDGLGIYGLNEGSGAVPTDLTACQSHVGPVPGTASAAGSLLSGVAAGLASGTVRHYHLTTTWPYSLGCYGSWRYSDCVAATPASCNVWLPIYNSDGSTSFADDWCPCALPYPRALPVTAPGQLPASLNTTQPNAMCYTSYTGFSNAPSSSTGAVLCSSIASSFFPAPPPSPPATASPAPPSPSPSPPPTSPPSPSPPAPSLSPPPPTPSPPKPSPPPPSQSPSPPPPIPPRPSPPAPPKPSPPPSPSPPNPPLSSPPASPTPPSPIAQWNKVDNGEVIALDIPYSVYAANQVFYREAFIAAVAAVSGRAMDSVYVTNFQASSIGTTIIYFDIILEGTDYDVVATAAAVQALFCPPAGSAVSVGTPSCPPLLAAMVANGLPVGGVFFNDQTSASTYSPSPTPGVNASQVGTWRFADSNEVVALDISYGAYATNQQYYKEAFLAGIAAALGVAQDAVFVNDFQQSAAGTTLLFFDVALPATSSSAIPAMFSQVAALFQPCNGAGVAPVGCPAAAALLSKLQQYGLPITQAYYNNQLAPMSGR